MTAPAGGGRLDLVLAEQVGDLSRSRLQRLIRDGRVNVDGAVSLKPGLRLSGGERLDVFIPPAEKAELQAESIPLEIVYEDSDVLILNKPAGIVVHPAAGHASRTLVNAVLAHAPQIPGVGGEIRPGVIHRLDKDTSGLIAFAKHDRAMDALQQQFARREVEKVYLALVDGAPATRSGRIETHIGRDPAHRQRMSVQAPGKGRLAVTLFAVLESFPKHTLMEVRPLTGRTHQIRVHLAFIDSPVVGDRVYGRRRPSLAVERQMLHAFRLSLHLPGAAERRTFEAPLPADFQLALEELRGGGEVRPADL